MENSDKIYKRLPYFQYFIDVSEDYNNTGNVHSAVTYTSIPYACNRFEKLIGVNHRVEYGFSYDEERDVIQIFFQKTNDNSDWFANIAEFASKYYDAFPYQGEALELHVHHGWATMYKTIKYQIREEWKQLKAEHPDAYTEIMGWSLGSGQAMLCCQDLNWNYGVKPYLYTFGSVKPFKHARGQKDLLDEYLAGIYEECYNFANRNDLVTYMPPFRGFRMLKRRTVGKEKRTLKNLLNPFYFHTVYDDKGLYSKKKKV